VLDAVPRAMERTGCEAHSAADLATATNLLTGISLDEHDLCVPTAQSPVKIRRCTFSVKVDARAVGSQWEASQ